MRFAKSVSNPEQKPNNEGIAQPPVTVKVEPKKQGHGSSVR